MQLFLEIFLLTQFNIYGIVLVFGKEEIKKYLVHGLKVVQSHVILIRGLAGTIDVDKG